MPAVAICGGRISLAGSHLYLGFRRLQWTVRWASVDSEDRCRLAATTQIAPAFEAGKSEGVLFPFSAAEGSLEYGDISWAEFHHRLGGIPLDLVVIQEGAWSFVGPRTHYAGVPVVYMAADPTRGPEKHIRDAVKSDADIIFVYSPRYVPGYQSTRARNAALAFYRRILPAAPEHPAPHFTARHDFSFSYNDDVIRPEWNAPKTVDVLFRGSFVERAAPWGFETAYGEGWHRAALLEHLRQETAFTVSVARNEPFRNWAQTLHSARIVLQIDGGTYPYLTGMTFRTFEVLGAGEFLLASEGSDIQRTFDGGCGTFPLLYHPLHHNFDLFDYELFRDQVLYWLAHPTEREARRRTGFDMVRRQHKPEDRAIAILRATGLACASSS